MRGVGDDDIVVDEDWRRGRAETDMASPKQMAASRFQAVNGTIYVDACEAVDSRRGRRWFDTTVGNGQRGPPRGWPFGRNGRFCFLYEFDGCLFGGGCFLNCFSKTLIAGKFGMLLQEFHVRRVCSDRFVGRDRILH